MSFAPIFIEEITKYLADNTGNHFVFADGDVNLKVGELDQGISGVFSVAAASPQPENVNPLAYQTIDFWSVNPSSNLGYQDLQYVYDLFHGNYAYTAGGWFVFSSEALGQIEDLDRDSEGRKIWKVSIYFVIRNLIS